MPGVMGCDPILQFSPISDDTSAGEEVFTVERFSRPFDQALEKNHY